MKRLLFLLLLLISFSDFASSVKPLDWDKPLIKRTFIDPTVDGVDVWRPWQTGGSHSTTIEIFVMLSDWAVRDMKATIAVRTYRLLGWTWQWVWMMYDVTIPKDQRYNGITPSISSNWVYNGEGYNSTSDFYLYGSEFYVASYGPL